MVRTQAAKRILALAKEAAVVAENNGARAFSSLATKGAKHGLTAVQQGSRIAGTTLASKCRCSCGRVMCMGNHYHTSVGQQQAEAAMADETAHAPSLTARHLEVAKHFPNALGVDDFIARLEMALAAYGFTGDNAIAMSNLCRDESCMILEDKIESVFGSCFSTHGLGGVLTCGVIGMGAGLSHSPVENGKERYVFFSFPHIAIDSEGKIGAIARPNRPGASAACGALIKTMLDLKEEGVDAAVSSPGSHDPLEPEYSILKSRIARRIKYEKMDISSMSLVDITKVAERVITTDLEYLISKAVNPKQADYAVVTGVQVHNWASDLEDERIPSMEFVAPARAYVVINGEKIDLDLQQVPALSPRQLQLLAAQSTAVVENSKSLTTGTGNSMLQEIPRDYLLNRLGGVNTSIHLDVEHQGPSWREYIKTTYHDAHHNAPKMDEHFFEDKQH
eukprot:GHUV01000414.1.p1 GENE.GHUV01000414.1~~GHUV01000414.1.p1  ORF type:complete len:449 (+),score=146.99 GHUV01000414.1:109-1455(+)